MQKVEGWEKVVNFLNTDFDVDIYVTGSNSRMMSSEISTYLTGRYVSFKIFTLSFSEYLEFKSKYTKVSDLHKEFAEYIKKGGFPATHLREYSEDEVYTIVHDIYNSTVFSDIVKRNQIRKIDLLEKIIKYVFSNAGNTFSAKLICDYLKAGRRVLDNETVYSYLELCRRGYSVYIGKTKGGEIDFVAEKQGNRIYIKVSQIISSDETEKREYSRLLELHDNYPKYLLTTDDFSDGNYEGIKTMHIADFLLSGEY